MAVATTTQGQSTELAPRLHSRAPSHLFHLLEELDEAVLVDAPSSALRALRHSFALLLGWSTDLVGAAAVSLGAAREMFIQPDDSTVRLGEAETRLREGLYFLTTQTESALAKEILEIFFNPADSSPRAFYLLTQGAKVDGSRSGLKRLSDFCEDANSPKGRSKSFTERTRYTPHLESWLHALNRVWEQSEVLWERTDLQGNQRIGYRLHGQELVVGARIQLHDCKACIPSRVLQAPAEWVTGDPYIGLPQDVPEHTLHLADRLSDSLQAADIIESTKMLRDLLEFLLRYFAGIGKLLCVELDCMNDEATRAARNTESVDTCETLLSSTVDCLKPHQDDLAAKELVGVFYRRDSNFEFNARPHTNILLLEGVLSSWFKQERGRQPDEARYSKDFTRFFPLLRDWVAATGSFFSHSENLSDEPSDEGQLPVTARCGEHLLEMVDDNYFLRIRQCPVCLPNPAWMRGGEARPMPPALSAQQLLRRVNQADQAAPAPVVETEKKPVTFPGEFKPLELPPDPPKFLGRVLRRLDVRLRRGELPETREAMRDALDYLVRYCAGVCWACAKNADKLSDQETALASQSLSVHECEKLLMSSLKLLNGIESELSEELLQVFYERDLFSNELKPVGSHTRMLLTDTSGENQMQLLADFCDSPVDASVAQARRDLKTYLPVVREWLPRLQNFFEQCQHHEEQPDSKGRMELVVQWDKDYLELVHPDYAFYVRQGADVVPDLEVPEYVEPEPEAEILDNAPKPKVITTEELALSEPFLMHRVQYVGKQKNSDGVLCLSGIISIQNAGGGSLTGRAYATHPCIQVAPNRFRDKTQLTYWLDERLVPRDFVPTLVLRSGGDERQVSLAELKPLSPLSTMGRSEARMILWAPSVGGFFAVEAILIFKQQQAKSRLNGVKADFKEAVPEHFAWLEESGGMIGSVYVLYAFLAPLLTLVVFRNLSHSMQDLMQPSLPKVLLSTLALSTAIALLAAVAFPLAHHAELPGWDMLQLWRWAVFVGLYALTYVYLELSGKFNEWIPDRMLRRLIFPVFLALFLMLWTLAVSH